MSFDTTPSFSAARATESLMVEQGCAPLDNASLLIHHGQHTSAGRLNRDYGAIHISQGIDSRLANDRIFPFSDIAAGNPFGERTHKKALVISV